MKTQKPNSIQSNKIGQRFKWKNEGVLYTQNGEKIDTSTDLWLLHGSSGQNCFLKFLELDLPSDIIECLKAYIGFCIETKSQTTAIGEFRAVTSCLLVINSEIDEIEDIDEAKFTFIQNRFNNKPHLLNPFKRWYKWCFWQKISGFSQKILFQFTSRKVRQPMTGKAVMSLDPEKGPFDEAEHYQIRQAVKAGQGTLEERLIVLLLLELGLRPAQLSLLRKMDFQTLSAPDGSRFFSVEVNEIKRRTVGGHEKSTRRISDQLGQLLEHYIQEMDPRECDDSENPLLFKNKFSSGRKKLRNLIQSQPSERKTTFSIKARLDRFSKLARLKSERTQTWLKLQPVRFRYTLATRLMEQGTPTLLLAKILGHLHRSSLFFYVKSTQTHGARIKNLLEQVPEYKQTMGYFAGTIQPQKDLQEFHHKIQGQIHSRPSLGEIGLCGATFLCKLYPPLSCYLCPKFIAWEDGPHAELLGELQRMYGTLQNATSDPYDRIPHQLNDLTLAMEELLQKIQKQNSAKEKDIHGTP